jgi:hypothetical protein
MLQADQLDSHAPMATLSDLPHEVLRIIFQTLSPSAIVSTCLVSKRLYEACLPVLYASFKASSNLKQTWRRFQLFLDMITRDHFLGQHVTSVLINHINDDDIAALQNSIDSLLSQASNIQQFAIPGHPNLLPALKRSALPRAYRNAKTFIREGASTVEEVY